MASKLRKYQIFNNFINLKPNLSSLDMQTFRWAVWHAVATAAVQLSISAIHILVSVRAKWASKD